MSKFIIKYLWHNKKQEVTFLTAVCIVGILFFSSLLLTFSIHGYMLEEVKEENGNYHVKLKTDLKGLKTVSFIKKIDWEEDVLITYNEISKTYQNTKKLCKEIKCENITYNEPLLSLYGVSQNENVLDVFKTIILISFILILSAGIIIISSVYNIILTSKYKDFGILKTIGFTNKNILLLLLTEGLLISFLALILSLFISALLINGALHLINHLTLNIISLKLIINFKFVILAILFIFIFILFICLVIGAKVRRKSIVNSLKPRTVLKKVKRFKNIYLRLAYFNYKRSRGHFRPVIISLSICFILIGTFSTYLDYGRQIIKHYVTLPSYDAEIVINDKSIKAKKILENFASENDAEKSALYKTCQIPLTISKENTLNNKEKKVNVVFIENEKNTFVNKATSIKEKDSKIVKEDTKLYKSKINVLEKEFKETTAIPYGLELLVSPDNLIVGVTNIEEVCDYSYALFIKSKNDLPLNKLLKYDNLTYTDMKKASLIINNFILVFQILMIGIIVLIMLVAVSAIISTVLISFSYRKKEFGILKALGLASFNPLIIYESLILTFKAFFISLPIVCFINCVVVGALNEILDITLSFSLKPLLISLVISILLIRMLMQLLHLKIAKMPVSTLLK